MTVFDHTNGFTRGEVDTSVADRFDLDFFRSASKRVDNWFPGLTGNLERRPAFAAAGGDDPVILADKPAVVDEGVECGEFFMRSFIVNRETYLLLMRKVCSDGWQSVTMTAYRVLADNSVELQFEDFFLVHYSNASTDLIAALNAASEPLPPDSFDGNVPQDFNLGLPQTICFAQVGPSIFVTSSLFPPYRVFVDDQGTAQMEQVAWFEELVGSVEVELNNDDWEGTDTLFQNQLEVGDKFFYDGDEYTVQSIANQTEMKSTNDFTTGGVSVSGVRIQKRTDYFDTDWPRLCTFYKGRLLLFSSREKPVGMWASAPNDPFTIRPGSVYPDAPIELDLLTEGAESFLWISAGEKVILGGAQSEYIVDTIADAPLTPTSFSFYRIANNGGASLQPFSTNASTVFVNRGRTQVLSVQFNDTRSGFVAQDLSLLAPHLLEGRVRDVVFRPGTRQDRAPRIFLLTEELELRSCTFAEQENVVAWNRMSLTEGYEVRAMATTPEDLFAIVKTPNEKFVLSTLDVGATEFYLMDYATDYTATQGVVPELKEFHKNTTVAVLDGINFLGYFETTDALDVEDAEYEGDLTVGVTYASRLEMLPPIISDEARNASLNRTLRLVRVMVGVQEAYELSINDEPLFGTVAENNVTGFPKREGTFQRIFFGYGFRPETSLSATGIYRATVLSISREIEVSG